MQLCTVSQSELRFDFPLDDYGLFVKEFDSLLVDLMSDLAWHQATGLGGQCDSLFCMAQIMKGVCGINPLVTFNGTPISPSS